MRRSIFCYGFTAAYSRFALKHGDGEIGRCAAVGNGFDDARRHEGERSDVSDVALDLVLASGDFLEWADPAFAEIVHARAGNVTRTLAEARL